MKPSKEAQYFIDRCYRDSMPVVVKPMFNVKYEFEGKEVKFTHELLNELKESELLKITNETDKEVTLMGIGG